MTHNIRTDLNLSSFTLICVLFLGGSVGCSRVSFNSISSATSASMVFSPPVVSGQSAADGMHLVVAYPLKMQVLNYPVLGGTSKLSVTVSGGQCNLILDHQLQEFGLCQSDPVLGDFCFIEILRSLDVAKDPACREVSAASIRVQRQGACQPRKNPLSSPELKAVRDSKIYQISTQQIPARPTEFDFAQAQLSLDEIGLDSDCTCYYDSSTDKLLSVRWPALAAQCEAHFAELL